VAETSECGDGEWERVEYHDFGVESGEWWLNTVPDIEYHDFGVESGGFGGGSKG